MCNFQKFFPFFKAAAAKATPGTLMALFFDVDSDATPLVAKPRRSVWTPLALVGAAAGLCTLLGAPTIGLLLLSAKGGNRPVSIQVFGESACPDTRDFFLGPLPIAVAALGDAAQVEYVGFGNAYYDTWAGSVPAPSGCNSSAACRYNATTRDSFFNACGAGSKHPPSSCFEGSPRCQHGASECLANRVQACAEMSAPFAACYFAALDGKTPSLGAWKAGSPPEDILAVGKKCAATVGLKWRKVESCINGTRGDELVEAAAARTPTHAGVPYVLVDGKELKETDDAAAIVRAVCAAVPGGGPAVCNAVPFKLPPRTEEERQRAEQEREREEQRAEQEKQRAEQEREQEKQRAEYERERQQQRAEQEKQRAEQERERQQQRAEQEAERAKLEREREKRQAEKERDKTGPSNCEHPRDWCNENEAKCTDCGGTFWTAEQIDDFERRKDEKKDQDTRHGDDSKDDDADREHDDDDVAEKSDSDDDSKHHHDHHDADDADDADAKHDDATDSDKDDKKDGDDVKHDDGSKDDERAKDSDESDKA
ncbi:hypothetical protein EMIHUDRAFT_447849 [Emiliania huxleyi CCMP1516]|uniref:Thioredoxin-like fold domain-containing protein n=2 Tax=Emiliania huxleyi TaxID=2903 RepID=A0A0D3JI19_EMIH1|nr:hypothetical protein EMIHUDRAFT_447849 [Emiliania huxleyi CCMP1516]EOD23154.1 hypothetical protein EMIHUDRAFT_447849 [Emiliania huxleyi CCMP1516]|eukprot:XP_005775583.1 hypothetical protein EMIHUDRAFT_447849 [Emiliania huxleyi CCMP1516]